MSDSEPPSIVLGTPSDFVSLTVFARTHPQAIDYWDGNWLSTDIHVRVGRFTAKVLADLRANELESLLADLRALHQWRSTRAVFETMEDWIALELIVAPRGHITVMGNVCDVLGTRSKLEFEFEIDLTSLPPVCNQLEKVVHQFPVRGRP